MKNTIFTCPVCGNKFDTVAGLYECVGKHQEEEKKKNDNERTAAEKKIRDACRELANMIETYNNTYGGSYKVGLSFNSLDNKDSKSTYNTLGDLFTKGISLDDIKKNSSLESKLKKKFNSDNSDDSKRKEICDKLDETIKKIPNVPSSLQSLYDEVVKGIKTMDFSTKEFDEMNNMINMIDLIDNLL